MAAYKIFFKSSVEKDFSKIPRKDLSEILKRIKLLAGEPRPPNCEKLTGQDRYRIRYGRYRVVYSIQDKELTVWVIKAAHRKNVYRG